MTDANQVMHSNSAIAMVLLWRPNQGTSAARSPSLQARSIILQSKMPSHKLSMGPISVSSAYSQYKSLKFTEIYYTVRILTKHRNNTSHAPAPCPWSRPCTLSRQLSPAIAAFEPASPRSSRSVINIACRLRDPSMKE